jgi:hypothetical protein
MFFSINAYAITQSDDAEQQAEEASATGSDYSVISREYHLKAAFLRYVAQFIEWPTTAQSTGTINICVLGLLPSYEAINSINGKVVNDRTLNVNRISKVSDAPGKCHLVFVTKTQENNIKEIINSFNTQPILDFGDMEHFAERGGDMNFYILNNRLAIMINPPAVERSNLKINERMMKVVTVVPPIGDATEQ